MNPAETGIRGRPPESLLGQPRYGPVIDDLAMLVAPRRVKHLAHRHLGDVARDDAIDQTRGILSGNEVLEERRNIDERRRIADGVVLVLVVRLIGADGVIA